jgi:MinD-like ATPase involved in chromosome partitioning or flagellar assembly
MIFLDVGTNSYVKFDDVVAHCQEIILIVEPHPTTIQRSKILLDELSLHGFGKSKVLTVVQVNRIRADVQLSLAQVQEALKQPVAQMIPPAPEAAYQAALQTLPLVQIHADGLLAQQFTRLAESLQLRLQK